MADHFSSLTYRPRLPQDRQRLGIAFVGCGSVVRKWHLPSYLANGLRVVGVWDRDETAIARILNEHAALRRYESLDALLNDPLVDVVDIATNVTGRAELICQAARAGKHVLAQKPLCRNVQELLSLRETLAVCPDVRIAVNFNGRWAPPWRATTALIRSGAIGDVIGITHLHDVRMNWLPDLKRHGSPLFLLFDYVIHWVDISLTWLGNERPSKVWAHLITHHIAPDNSLASQIGWLNFVTGTGTCICIRSVAAGIRYNGHPFIVHGTRGTLQGAVDAPARGDYVELDDGDTVKRPNLTGNWFPDGFIGSIGELLSAIEEGREPDHGLNSAIRTQELVFAACRSAELGGRPMELDV